MRTVRIQVDRIHCREQPAHFDFRQRLPDAHHRVTGDGRQQAVHPRFERARALGLGEIGSDRTNDRRNGFSREQRRNRAHQHRPLSERLDLEAASGQIGRRGGEQLGLSRADFDRLRHQHRLRFDSTALPCCAQPLERDALVRRVLIDEHDVAASLTHEVAVEDLTDDPQRREPTDLGERQPRMLGFRRRNQSECGTPRLLGPSWVRR